MGALQPEHVLLILVVVLILFGAGRLPETLGQLGKGVRDFRAAAMGKEPSAPPTAAPPPTATPSRLCPSCAVAVAADARFCSRCGAAVPSLN